MLDPANDNTWLIGTEISFRNQSEVTYKCRLIESELEAKETFELNGRKCSNPIVIVK